MMPGHQFQESDCKTSPLAYLVQICSNIGAEKPSKTSSSSSSTTNGTSSDKSNDDIRVTKDSKDVLSASSPDNSVRSTPTLSSSKREDVSNSYSSRDKDSSSSKRNTPSEPRSSPRSPLENRRTPASHHDSGSNSSERKSPPDSNSQAKSSNDVGRTNGSASSLAGTDSHVPTSSSSTTSDRESSYSSSLALDFGRTEGSGGLLGSSKESTPGSLSQVGLGNYKAGLNGLNPLALANCSGCSPVAGHIPLDVASATYPLAAANALKSGGYGFGSTLSSYMNYARMKTATGASTFVPVCRDPYCTNCQLAAQLPYAQDRLAAHLTASSGLYPAGLSAYLPGTVPGFAGPASSAYVTSVLPRPIVCSWMVGDTYCGKKFATSEELFQHLRTHTSLPGASGGLPLYSAGVSLPSALSMDSAACGLYTTPPSLTTPAGLRRTYPTSLSPVSSLSAASRYHPYKPPGLSPLSSAAALPPLGHPSLGFFNPYSGVYGKG